MKIRKGDKVLVIAGKDKGFKGEVLKVDEEKGRVTVDGANLIKKHIKAPKREEKGQRIEYPAPMSISNVQLLCATCKKAVRVGSVVGEDGKKKRICKKCKKEI